VCSILLVLLLFFFNSGDVLAQGDVAVPHAAAPGNADSDRHHDETVGNGTAAGNDHEGSTADEPVSEEQASPAAVDERVYQFDPVRVLAEKQQAGKTTIEGQELHSLPSHTGSITEAIKGFSNVQFSNDEISSLTGGEIRPPRVTISGAKPYENNFLIDGMSVSNTLNPSGLGTDGDSVLHSNLQVNGADQTIFYDTGLVDTVTVYSSNVPAKYGGFLGGVVAAELVDPRMDRWHGKVEGRHTRSEWFDLRAVDDDSVSSANQPRFRQYGLFGSLDGPISENAALLFAVSRRESVIPLRVMEQDGSIYDKQQIRLNENYFARLLLQPTDDVKLTLDGTYAPYMEKRWKPKWIDSDWESENKAWRLAGALDLATRIGDLTAKAAYSQNGYSRDSLRNHYEQVIGTSLPSEEWVYRGGVGDATVENRSLDLMLGLDFKEMDTGLGLWRVSSGMDFSSVVTDMWNEETWMDLGVYPKSGNWTQTHSQYMEYDQTKSLNTFGWYAQAQIELGRLTLVPGLRLDYDDFSHNTDFSPRLKAEFDTMDDGRLRLVAGANRYHGKQLRAYAFDRHRPSITYQYKPGVPPSGPKYSVDYSYQAKDLKTPYSDEVMAGVLGEVGGIEYSLELVHRDHRQQVISKKFGDDTFTLTNDGKSTYDGLTLSLARSFAPPKLGEHKLTLGATKSVTRTFNGAFDSDIILDNPARKSGVEYFYNYNQVYFNGEIIDRADMPADNYNAPLVLTLSWLGSFYDDRLRLNWVSRWRDSTTGLVRDARVPADTPYGTTSTSTTFKSSQWLNDKQEYHDAFKKGVISGGLASDLSLELDAVKKDLFTLTFLLDVTNIFSSDGHSGVAQEGVPRDRMRGRGYYAGIRCEF
jgi:hypothetical protein